MDALHFFWWWYGLVFGFLKNNEWIALWLEGLALVAIFWHDRKDAEADHKETLQQLDLARRQLEINRSQMSLMSSQIEVSRKQVQASQDAERAWLMTELKWRQGADPDDGIFRPSAETSRMKVVHGTTNDKETTSALLRISVVNKGRSPAWVERILGYSEIVDKPRDVSDHVGHPAQHLGWMEPLGPEIKREKDFTLECDGKLTDEQVLAVVVVVEYRDIFENKRSTSAGYIVNTHASSTYLRRQDERPDRNKSV